MSEERKRILEMLAEGKLSVDEAERLLTAVGDPSEDHQKEGEPDTETGEDEDGFNVLDDLGGEIRAGMAEAEAALKEIGPEAVAVVRGAERAVRQVLRRTSRSRRRYGFGRSRSRKEAKRRVSDTLPFGPGRLLTLQNEKGDVLIETWDKVEVCFEAEIIARARTVEDARLLAESVEISVRNGEDELCLESSLPNEEGGPRGSWQANFLIRVPETSDLDITSRHGHTRLPGIQGDVSVRNAHGVTNVEGVSGSLRARQSHGNLKVGTVGADASIDVRHGHLEAESIGGALTLKNQHGNAKIGQIAKDLDTFSAHGNVTIGSVGAVDGRIRHSKFHIQDSAGGNISLDASHGSLRAKRIVGNLTMRVHHGSIESDEVSGHVDIDSSHSPVSLRRVGKDAAIRSNHSPITLHNVGGDVTIQANHAAITLSTVAGRVEVTGSRGSIDVDQAAGSVTIESERGAVDVKPDGPITDDYRITSHRANVDLLLPEGSDAEIQGKVEHGEVQCSISSIEVEESNNRTKTISGRLGDGNAKVQLVVDRASLRLRAEDR